MGFLIAILGFALVGALGALAIDGFSALRGRRVGGKQVLKDTLSGAVGATVLALGFLAIGAALPEGAGVVAFSGLMAADGAASASASRATRNALSHEKLTKDVTAAAIEGGLIEGAFPAVGAAVPGLEIGPALVVPSLVVVPRVAAHPSPRIERAVQKTEGFVKALGKR